MKLALLLSLLASQAAYEWVDAQGESHFTDDPSTIPKGARRRTVDLDPQDAPVVKLSPVAVDGGARDARVGAAPATAKPSELPSCAAAEQRVSDLEAKQAQARAAAEKAKAEREAYCQQRLRTHGRPAYAACLIQDEKPVPDLSAEIAAARDALRRVQQSGCR